MLTGEWCTEELKLAVEKGYIIHHIYECWHFAETSTSLFTDYVNTWLKIKQESSGWPTWVGSDPTKRQQYIEDYERKENIRLNPEKIEGNPGLRSLAKLMLNSFWGKFGQRSNLAATTTCTDPVEFFELLRDDSLEIVRILPINEYVVEVVHRKRQECEQMLTNTNIFIAIFTTAHARIKLYRALDLLQEQVLYFDTGKTNLSNFQKLLDSNFLSKKKKTLLINVILILLFFF